MHSRASWSGLPPQGKGYTQIKETCVEIPALAWSYRMLLAWSRLVSPSSLTWRGCCVNHWGKGWTMCATLSSLEEGLNMINAIHFYGNDWENMGQLNNIWSFRCPLSSIHFCLWWYGFHATVPHEVSRAVEQEFSCHLEHFQAGPKWSGVHNEWKVSKTCPSYPECWYVYLCPSLGHLFIRGERAEPPFPLTALFCFK